ncbi:MAG: hypothetical protein H8E21_02885 [Gammaproteobacteria bacterium]|nr:hypothetical protein [Gammaproteobacteria bacterium]
MSTPATKTNPYFSEKKASPEQGTEQQKSVQRIESRKALIRDMEMNIEQQTSSGTSGLVAVWRRR